MKKQNLLAKLKKDSMFLVLLWPVLMIVYGLIISKILFFLPGEWGWMNSSGNRHTWQSLKDAIAIVLALPLSLLTIAYFFKHPKRGRGKMVLCPFCLTSTMESISGIKSGKVNPQEMGCAVTLLIPVIALIPLWLVSYWLKISGWGEQHNFGVLFFILWGVFIFAGFGIYQKRLKKAGLVLKKFLDDLAKRPDLDTGDKNGYVCLNCGRTLSLKKRKQSKKAL